MKKCSYFLMVILLALVSVGFAACEDDEPKYTSDLVGTWSYNTQMIGDFATYLQFTKDGKFHEVHTSFPNGETLLDDVFNGTYTVSGNVLTITYNFKYEDEIVKCLYDVEGDKMTLTFEDDGEEVTATFIRVNDSVIEEYL